MSFIRFSNDSVTRKNIQDLNLRSIIKKKKKRERIALAHFSADPLNATNNGESNLQSAE